MQKTKRDAAGFFVNVNQSRKPAGGAPDPQKRHSVKNGGIKQILLASLRQMGYNNKSTNRRRRPAAKQEL